MNKTVEFKSILSPYLAAFIREHKAKGYNPENLQSILRAFDHYLFETRHADACIKKSDYDKWLATLSGYSPAAIYIKAGVLARFLRYMSDLGHECYIPRIPRRPARDFVPYVYSHDEMAKLFNEADALRMKRKDHKSAVMVMPALLRLLYSTGIRIGEALSIKNRDIDFNRHVITLNETKNGCQRLAPVNSSLEVVLKQYILCRNRMPVAGLEHPDSPLFVSGTGKSPARNTVYNLFHYLIMKAGIPYRGGHKGPNLHGIRHTSCVHALLKMTRNGRDMYAGLPVLSAFMGHKRMIDTEMYIHLTQEMYPELMEMDRSVTAGISKVIARALITENGKENENDSI